MTTSLVVTVIGADRPGIVNLLSDVAQQFEANWAGSRMASLAGEFAGMVHFEVAEQKVDAFAEALRALEASGLQVAIARSDVTQDAPPHRLVRLELVGHDRPGIVRELSGNLASRNVSIQELHTEVVSAAMSAEHLFKMKALLAVPEGLPDRALRDALEALANELMIDIEVEGR